jgi:branched-chain amino acid transport system permease protein
LGNLCNPAKFWGEILRRLHLTGLIQIIIGGVLEGSIYAVLALGFSLIFRVAGVINLSQGAFCIAGALTMYSFEVTLGWPTPLAAAASVGSIALAAFLIGTLTFVPAMSRLPNSGVLMLTVGILTLIEGAALIVWGSEPYALPPFSGEHPVEFLGLRVASQGLWIFGVTTLVVIALWYLLARTSLGQSLRACAENMMAARLMGIDVRDMMLLSFVLAAVIAAIGGILISPITSLQFDSGRLFSIYGFIAVAIGGMGSFAGAVFGGLFLGIVSQLAAAYVSSLFSNALALGILLLVLIFRPSGLFAGRTARRTDVRDEQRVYSAAAQIRGPTAWALGVIAAVGLFTIPSIVPAGGLLNSLVITGIWFIAVLGLDILMGFAGQVSLGQAAFTAIGGYTAAILATNHGLPPLAATMCGAVLAVACSIVLGLVTARLRGHYLALATLAFGLLVDSIAVGWTDLTGGPSGLVGIPSFSMGGFSFSTPLSMYYLVASLIVVLVLFLAGGMQGSFGRALQAIRTDPLAAAALGINVPRYKLAAITISAALAGVAGSLYAFNFHFLSPEMVGTQRSLEMLGMLVIGGEATLAGPIIGVALLTLLPTIFQPLALYKTLATGVLLIVFFSYLPQGIFGTIANALARLGGKRGLPNALPAGAMERPAE